MTFQVDLDGRARSVSIERAGRAGAYRVTVDGRQYDLDARRTGEYGLLLTSGGFPPKVQPSSADKSQGDTRLEAPAKAPITYEVFVTPAGEAGDVLVTFEGRTARAVVNGRRTGRAADIARQSPGEQPVVAPMPGRVVRVLVAPGDQVSARQGLVVVEAMKMENELRAPKGGRVKNVSVSAGASVEAGRVLVVIE